MAFPPPAIAADKANETRIESDHPAHHNALANAVNDITDTVAASGEPTGVDPSTPTTLAFTYGATTSTVTVTPTGETLDIWLAGTRYALTGAQTIDFTTADGSWFIYYQSDGWHASQTPWAIDSATAQVALVYIDKTTAGAGLLADERHGIAMDWATHARLHTVDGSQVSAGATIADYVVNSTTFGASNPGVADTQFSLSSTTLRDEDITLTLGALASAGPYHLARRIGTGTQYTWTTAAYPFFTVGNDYTAGAAYITFNQLAGGTTWQQTALTTGQFVNYYVFATDFVSPASARFLSIPGQAVHTTLAAAQAESVLGLVLSGFPAAEFAPLYQLTFQASSNINYNDVPGRVRLAAAPVRLVGYKASVASAVAPSSHTALSNRSDADSHPSTAVSFTGAGFTATDVSAALLELRSAFPVLIGVALSDETTAITTGTGKATLHVPFAFTLTGVHAEVNTVSSSGAVTVDINEGAAAGTTVLSTKLTIDQSEETSATAATPAVISDSAIAAAARLTFDIDGAGTGAKGLKVWLSGTRSL